MIILNSARTLLAITLWWLKEVWTSYMKFSNQWAIRLDRVSRLRAPQIVYLHWVKSVHSRSYSGPYFCRIFPHLDWIWGDTSTSPYTVRMRGNAAKIRTRITPNTDTFYAVLITGAVDLCWETSISSYALMLNCIAVNFYKLNSKLKYLNIHQLTL